MERIVSFGRVSLVNVARASVTWFLGESPDSFDDALSAACHFGLRHPTHPISHRRGTPRFALAHVRFPYVVVVEPARGVSPSQLATLTEDVAADLRQHLGGARPTPAYERDRGAA